MHYYFPLRCLQNNTTHTHPQCAFFSCFAAFFVDLEEEVAGHAARQRRKEKAKEKQEKQVAAEAAAALKAQSAAENTQQGTRSPSQKDDTDKPTDTSPHNRMLKLLERLDTEANPTPSATAEDW